MVLVVDHTSLGLSEVVKDFSLFIIVLGCSDFGDELATGV
jgi:hypothetical protein